MKDIVTNYWLNYKISTIEFGDYTRDNKNNRPSNHALQNKFAIVTIHDAAPEFSKKIFTQANELEKLNIPFNFAVIPYFRDRRQRFEVQY